MTTEHTQRVRSLAELPNLEVTFSAEGPLPSVFGGHKVGSWNNGRLTIPANIYGSPAISIPAGVEPESGLPVGMQVLGRHFTVIQIKAT